MSVSCASAGVHRHPWCEAAAPLGVTHPGRVGHSSTRQYHWHYQRKGQYYCCRRKMRRLSTRTMLVKKKARMMEVNRKVRRKARRSPCPRRAHKKQIQGKGAAWNWLRAQQPGPAAEMHMPDGRCWDIDPGPMHMVLPTGHPRGLVLLIKLMNAAPHAVAGWDCGAGAGCGTAGLAMGLATEFEPATGPPVRNRPRDRLRDRPKGCPPGTARGCSRNWPRNCPSTSPSQAPSAAAGLSGTQIAQPHPPSPLKTGIRAF